MAYENTESIPALETARALTTNTVNYSQVTATVSEIYAYYISRTNFTSETYYNMIGNRDLTGSYHLATKGTRKYSGGRAFALGVVGVQLRNRGLFSTKELAIYGDSYTQDYGYYGSDVTDGIRCLVIIPRSSL